MGCGVTNGWWPWVIGGNATACLVVLTANGFVNAKESFSFEIPCLQACLDFVTKCYWRELAKAWQRIMLWSAKGTITTITAGLKIVDTIQKVFVTIRHQLIVAHFDIMIKFTSYALSFLNEFKMERKQHPSKKNYVKIAKATGVRSTCFDRAPYESNLQDMDTDKSYLAWIQFIFQDCDGLRRSIY